MALVYFDSSSFVKLLLAEDGRPIAVALWDGCYSAVSSRLAYPEVCSALAAAGRDRRLGRAGLKTARRVWEGHWDVVRPIELIEPIAEHAGVLASKHSLRGADAVHLASALAIADADLVMAVWDRRLRDGAAAEGLRTVPAR